MIDGQLQERGLERQPFYLIDRLDRLRRLQQRPIGAAFFLSHVAAPQQRQALVSHSATEVPVRHRERPCVFRRDQAREDLLHRVFSQAVVSQHHEGVAIETGGVAVVEPRDLLRHAASS